MVKQKKGDDDPRTALIGKVREALEALRVAMRTRQGNRGAMALLHQMATAYRAKYPDVDFADALSHPAATIRNAEDAIRQSATWAACGLIALGEELLPLGWSIDAGRRLSWFLIGLAQERGPIDDESRERRALAEEKDLFPLLQDAYLWLKELERRIEVTKKPTDRVPASMFKDLADSRVSSQTQVKRFAIANNVPMRETPKGAKDPIKLRLDGDAMRRALAGKKRAADRVFNDMKASYELLGVEHAERWK